MSFYTVHELMAQDSRDFASRAMQSGWLGEFQRGYAIGSINTLASEPKSKTWVMQGILNEAWHICDKSQKMENS